MSIRILTVKLEGNKLDSRDIPKIRGYLAERFPQHIELHNHIGKDKFNYAYPVIQYKSIDGVPKVFVASVSERILRDYPGVEVFMVIEDYDENDKKLTISIEDAYKKLAIKKNNRQNSGSQVSFGIERICESSGLPAIEDKKYETGERPFISMEIQKKIDNSKSCKKFELLINHNNGSKEFADLAKGEKNYLAVVHIDGNKMGKKFDQLKDYFKYKEGEYAKTNKEYLGELRKFSSNIKDAYISAFKEMSRVVELNKSILSEDTNIELDKFPIIPIIVAGDDITYVTNGKIGIETARIFLEYLNKNEIEMYNGDKVKLNACAGVAIARVSNPFSKTYQLAEDLCSNAKRRIQDDYPNDGDKDFSLIDWHIEQGDLIGEISDIREKHYKSRDGKDLCMRPLYINNDSEWKSYENFKATYFNICKREINENKISRNKISRNKISRNKIKELREILKNGESATEIFLKSNAIDGYFSRLEKTFGDNCFYDNNCMYYDAIEVMDLYIELEGVKE